eukprot:gene460-281_t
MVLTGYWNHSTYLAYTIFFAVGTTAATFVPVVGWTPLRSLEQAGPLLVFLGYQYLEFCQVYRERKEKENGKPMTFKDFNFFRFKVALLLASMLAVVVMLLIPTGFFGPFSARIRGLFVKHTKTVNPLVDSVAEHQPANEQAYMTYLHYGKDIAPYGLILCVLVRTPARYFALIYAAVAYTFSLKMARLMIICGPICAMLTGTLVGECFDFAFAQITECADSFTDIKSLFKKKGEPKAEEVDGEEEEEGKDETEETDDKKPVEKKARKNSVKKAFVDNTDPYIVITSSKVGQISYEIKTKTMDLVGLVTGAIFSPWTRI